MTTTLAGVELRSVAVLAPMAGMTDLPFRLLCREQNCGLVYTELVHADTLLAGVNKSLQLAETWPEERPVGVQLYHHDPAVLAEAARHVAEHVDCDLIDLNMGCPVPKIVSRGAGAALMKQPRLVEALVRSVVDAVEGTGIPVTAKTRSGWDADSINAVEVAKAIEGGGGQVVAVHARTRAQRHEGPVDWDLLGFFAALFVVIHVMEHAQVLALLGHGLQWLVSLGDTLGTGALLVATAGFSSVTDNIPLAAMLAKILGAMGTPSDSQLWWAVVFGANLGGNVTPIGSASTLVAVTIIHKNKLDLSFAGFVKVAAPFALMQLVLATIYVLAFL